MLLCSFSIEAQRSIDRFGKNRVQHEVFDWKYLTSNNFNIYYYQGGERIAHNAARHLEADIERLTDLLAVNIYDRTELIIYNSVKDFEQSNIGLNNQVFVGGETDLVKAKIEVPFKGSHVQFEKDLVENVSLKFMELLLFGGGLKQRVQTSYMLQLPDWFLKGAAAYAANEKSPEMLGAVYDALYNNDFDPSKLHGENARLIGQSYWYFLQETYGKETLANVINLARITRSEETALLSTVGLDYEELTLNWQVFYKKLFYDKANEFGHQTEKHDRIRKRNAKEYNYDNFKYSPDGKHLAYSENIDGKIRVKLLNTETGKKKIIYTGGYRIVNQEINHNIPILAWRSNNEISIIRYKKGKPWMITKNISTNKKEKKEFVAFKEILDVDYSYSATEMVISAVQNGRSDIFVYNYKSNRAIKITNDFYDDLYPRYDHQNNRIVFSSNRNNDTIGASFGDANSLQNHFDLFSFDAKERKVAVLDRLSFSKINEIKAQPIGNNQYLVLFKKNNQHHIAKLDLNSDTIKQVSNFGQNFNDFHYNTQTNTFAITQQNKYRSVLIQDDYFSLDSNYYTYNKYEEELGELSVEDTFNLLDNLTAINLDLLRFESDPRQKVLSRADSLISKEETLRKLQKTYGPYKYKGLYAAEYIVSNLLLDPLRGGGILLETGTAEMFYNHKVNLSIHILADLFNSNFYIEYENLKRRNDLRLRFGYENILMQDANSGETVSYNSNKIEGEWSHPVSPVLRYSFSPFLMRARYTQYSFNPADIDQNTYFGGTKLELIFDNTKETMLNLLDGSRMKVSFSPYLTLSDKPLNFSKFNIDYRKYTRLYKKIYLAARVGYGRFSGQAERSFLLGGMDNWLGAQTDNTTGSETPLRVESSSDNTRMLFIDYVTNVRGFNYNKMYGNQYAILNAEVRIPVVQIFNRGPIASDFFRNLILMGFYDMGSAWSEGSPFTHKNDINTQEPFSEGSPFNKTVVNNYINPFIQSMGIGARSMLFGYYMKLDLAWPIENYITKKPRLFLTLGYDF